jgi:hypothetical protein
VTLLDRTTGAHVIRRLNRDGRVTGHPFDLRLHTSQIHGQCFRLDGQAVAGFVRDGARVARGREGAEVTSGRAGTGVGPDRRGGTYAPQVGVGGAASAGLSVGRARAAASSCDPPLRVNPATSRPAAAITPVSIVMP